MAAGRRYHEAVWDDEEELAAPPVDAAGPARRPAPRPSRRLLVGAAVVVALAGGGALVVDRVREARVDERLARTDGLSADLGRPLVAAWSVPGEDPRFLDDLVIVQRERTTVAVRLDDGTVRYEAEGRCAPTTPTGAVPPDEALVVCERYEGDGEGPGFARVVVLAAATGERLQAFTVPAAGGGSSVVARHLVRHQVDLGGRFEVTALSLRTGEEAWTHEGREGGGFPGVFAWSSRLDEVVLDVSGERVRFDAATGEVRAGETLVGWEPGGTAQRGAGWEARQVLDGSGRPAVRVGAEDGDGTGGEDDVRGDGPLLPGVLAVTAVDDGTAPGLVVLLEDVDGGQDLVAHDPGSGDEVWRTGVPRGALRADLLEGLLVVATSEGVRALDAATGEERWRTAAGAAVGRGQLTDGRRVLAPETADGVPALVARALGDGRLLWRTPVTDVLPASAGDGQDGRDRGGDGGTDDLELRRGPDGAVVAADGRTVARLVPPGDG
ncbi:PQQ-binding-like beta-propeller repeat protein [Cellulomonas marina]|uniref:PQQ-like domain-containing protein n=1 Tax=Cellulomonas marina TaxID=988821 RepID=A0A1I1ASF4_9CELL|nr:PQQ-binding-like beta-propeller repeat protein [Cellulomonas marina]GIG30266.1 hypothetical protein Cma02nite_28660 [Cellulomonas marina]SFB40954.1 PQQ-like domain-containing protein [Cellulomonas marina]